MCKRGRRPGDNGFSCSRLLVHLSCRGPQVWCAAGVVYMDAADLEMPASGPSDLAKMPASGPSAKAKRPDTYDASDSSTDDGGGSASPAKPAAPPTQAPGASQTTTKATGKSTGYAGFMADEDEDEEQSNW